MSTAGHTLAGFEELAQLGPGCMCNAADSRYQCSPATCAPSCVAVPERIQRRLKRQPGVGTRTGHLATARSDRPSIRGLRFHLILLDSVAANCPRVLKDLNPSLPLSISDFSR